MKKYRNEKEEFVRLIKEANNITIIMINCDSYLVRNSTYINTN